MADFRLVALLVVAITASLSTSCDASGTFENDGSLTALIQTKTELRQGSGGVPLYGMPSGFFTQDGDEQSKPVLETDSSKHAEEDEIAYAAHDVGIGAVPLPAGFVETPSVPPKSAPQLAPHRLALTDLPPSTAPQHIPIASTPTAPARRSLLDEDDVERMEALKRDMDQNARHKTSILTDKTCAEETAADVASGQEQLALLERNLQDASQSALSTTAMVEHTALAVEPKKTLPEQGLGQVANVGLIQTQLPVVAQQVAWPSLDPVEEELDFVLAQGDLGGKDARHQHSKVPTTDPGAARAAAFAADRYQGLLQAHVDSHQKLSQQAANWGLATTYAQQLTPQNQAELLLAPVHAATPKDKLRKDVIYTAMSDLPTVSLGSASTAETLKLRAKNAQLVSEIEKQQHQIQAATESRLNDQKTASFFGIPMAYIWIAAGVVFAVAFVVASLWVSLSWQMTRSKRVRFSVK